MTQFALLAHVRALTTPTIGDIATAMSLDQTTASRNVEVLRREGLLSVERENRRTIVDLTRAGNRALERAFPLWKAAQEEATRRAGGEAAWMDTKRRLASLVGTAENEPPTTLRGR
jgi:DNA-binding MarR family transcriptional regulator